MRFLEGKCKICGKRAVGKFEDQGFTDAETLQMAVDKFLPMLTCDRCYDLRDKRNRAFGVIVNVCFILKHESSVQSDYAELLKERLTRATREYAEAIAGILRAPEVIWHRDFVAMLMERPGEVGGILRRYREQVRETTRREQGREQGREEGKETREEVNTHA